MNRRVSEESVIRLFYAVKCFMKARYNNGADEQRKKYHLIFR